MTTDGDLTTDGDRPLADCLDSFWQGRFTLREDPDLEAAGPALDRLGPSGITVRGRDLAGLLAPAYRRLTSGE